MYNLTSCGLHGEDILDLDKLDGKMSNAECSGGSAWCGWVVGRLEEMKLQWVSFTVCKLHLHKSDLFQSNKMLKQKQLI